jgi:ribosome-interacting GTPase 1
MKSDLPGAQENLAVLRELYPACTITPVSIYDTETLQRLREETWRLLGVIRIYGKAPGKPADMERPFILKAGSTVIDLAYEIHRDFPNKLKSALVWGSARFDGQPVARDYVLKDRDIVELVV